MPGEPSSDNPCQLAGRLREGRGTTCLGEPGKSLHSITRAVASRATTSQPRVKGFSRDYCNWLRSLRMARAKAAGTPLPIHPSPPKQSDGSQPKDGEARRFRTRGEEVGVLLAVD